MTPTAAALSPRRQIAEIADAEITRALRRRDAVLGELATLDASIARMRDVQRAVGITTDPPSDPEQPG